MTSIWKTLMFMLLLAAVSVWIAVVNYSGNLRVVACNVGQGDSILINLGKTQILIDGGPDRKVLDCLSKHVPFWDRTIEIVILTHPQKDHFGGLIEVAKRHNIKNFVATPLDNSSEEYRALKTILGGRGVKVIQPRKGQSIRVGLMHFDILSPSDDILSQNLTCDELKKEANILGY